MGKTTNQYFSKCQKTVCIFWDEGAGVREHGVMFDGRAAGVDFSDVITLAQLRRFEAREPGAAECDADATDDANMEWEMH